MPKQPTNPRKRAAAGSPARRRTTASAPSKAARSTPAAELRRSEQVGSGGELHQRGGDPLTTNHGTPIADNQNSLRLGDRGPTLLEDFVLREKIFHFDHERIPERIVHARGSGAHGYFECTDPIPELTRASLFQRKGMRVPVFVRFSTVAGGAGSVDTPRDVRGFAVKFYTPEGNWDLVGNNIPVFFIQDAIKFPDLVHSVKMESDRGYPQAASAHDTFWDFVSLMPESTHMLMWAMSDRTIPRSLRTIEGFGVHTFRFVNHEGASTFVKFHWRPQLGLQSTTWDEAVKLAGADPDFHRRDLWTAIDEGNFPAWDLHVQTFDEATADALPFDVFDATKLIPEELVPLRKVGTMVLDRNPDNFFAETEQVAFLPSNVVPGIDFSDDPLLQGRLFSYLDTQKSRLGTTNFHQIPINAPKCPMHNFQRDGVMQTMVPTGRANYEPNSLNAAGEPGGPRPSEAGFASVREVASEGASKRRIRPESFADHYSQARMFFRSQTGPEQDHIVAAFTFELSKVTLAHVRQRMLANLRNVDEDLASRVASGLGAKLPAPSATPADVLDLDLSPALSILAKSLDTLAGRTVGILFTDGSPSRTVTELADAVRAAGAKPMLIAPRLQRVRSKPKMLDADGQLAGTPSVVCDAVAVVVNDAGAAALCAEAAAVQFVSDAFVHLKAIGATPEAKPLLERARVAQDAGVTGLGDDFTAAAARRFYEREPSVRPAP